VSSDLIIDAIYDIATEPDAFAALGEAFAQSLHYRYGLISVRQNGVPVEFSLNQPAVVLAAYTDYYYLLDPWTGAAARTRFGDVIEMVDDPRFYDSEFYLDFARPMGIVDPIGVKLDLGGGRELLLGLNQPLTSLKPTEEDGRRLQMLGGHLQRAMQLRSRLGRLEQDRNQALAALDRLDLGIIITDPACRVSVLNRAAEQALLVGCGLRVRGNMLETRDPAMSSRLTGLISDAGGGGSGGALRLQADETNWINLIVSPLPPGIAEPTSTARAMVTFALPNASASLDEQVLMALFRLSRIEAQVAMGLMEGLSLEEIASRRGVRPSTLKSQLDSVFRKTDTSSQRALVRLLGSLPPVRRG
jgi:DNA-binding CsgD family transcriptional regulator